MLKSILDCLACVFQPQGWTNLLSNILNVDAICYNLIEFGLGVAVVVDGLEDFLAEVIHCFGIIETLG